MPARLVYAPKAYVFTKNSAGDIINVTDYVTSGTCQRLTDQASSASVTLRNPNKIFTKPANGGPTFHPMDGITIFLERLKGFPVQVFTGYLDDTPYYQMFPGTVTIQATCTLKKLMYTYFDPALPYVNAFLYSMGWINSGSGTLIQGHAVGPNQGTVGGPSVPVKDGNLKDASIGKLLYATLTDIGEWDDKHVWIENLPTGADGLAARISSLMAQLATAEKAAADEFTAFMTDILGAGSQGSGGGSAGGGGGGSGGGGGTASGPVQGASSITQMVERIANQYNIPPSLPLEVMFIETEFHNQDSAGNPHYGWFQCQLGGCYAYGPWSYGRGGYTIADTHDLGLSCTAFCAAAAGLLKADPSLANNEQTWAMRTQGVNLQNNPRYGTAWPDAVATAKSYLSQYGTGASSPGHQGTPGQANGSSTQTGSASGNLNFSTPGHQGIPGGSAIGGGGGGQTTRIDAVISAAATINNAHLKYVWGGGHTDIGTPTIGIPGPGYDGKTAGFDCSGAVASALSAGGYFKAGGSVGSDIDLIAQLKNANLIADGPSNGQGITLNDYPGRHIFMTIKGESFGTEGGGQTPSGSSGGGWLGRITPESSVGGAGLTQYHIIDSTLNESTTYSFALGNSGGGLPGGSGGTTGNITANSAEAFTGVIDLPSFQDVSESVFLGTAHKGLMHDQQLLPFVQQLAKASMRSFQSLPNGDFFAFYPDYFGEFNHHPAYWNIKDIEILSGDIYLNDSTLVTHQYVVGDNTYPVSNSLANQLFSSGVITVFNAFSPGVSIINTSKDPVTKLTKKEQGMADVMAQAEAIEFIKRYGARPQVADYPQVRSSLYEMFIAYQQFMLAWATQFRSTFSFTFMPEIFPGGKVGFPDHGIQMYVESVTHSWDYESGFTTDAVLMAPSQLPGSNNNPDIPPNMVQALVEPVRAAAQDSAISIGKKKARKKTIHDVGGVGGQVTDVGRNIPRNLF